MIPRPPPLDVNTLVSVVEAERAEVITELEYYLVLLTSTGARPIVQDVAAVLAFERLHRLHELDTEPHLSH